MKAGYNGECAILLGAFHTHAKRESRVGDISMVGGDTQMSRWLRLTMAVATKEFNLKKNAEKASTIVFNRVK